MKPNKIFSVLDLARRVRNLGGKFNPLFVGAPGVGKSEIVQQWAIENNLPFIDLRAAYLEAPDVIGFPSVETVNGRGVTIHNIPEFWPVDGEGVLLLEEPNRGTTSIMNCFMQLLTDRKVHKYDLPKGWIIVGCINPENEQHDVNTMDAALKNRFSIYDVTYDKLSFVDFMKQDNWKKEIQMFIESNSWAYKLPEEIGDAPGTMYISPRTWSKVNDIMRAGMDAEDELMNFQVHLGSGVGKDFFNFIRNETPVLYSELTKSPDSALRRLEKFCDPKSIKNGMIGITIKDIVDNEKISDDLLVKVLKVLPVDQGTALISDLELKRNDNNLLQHIVDSYPEIRDNFKSVLRRKK